MTGDSVTIDDLVAKRKDIKQKYIIRKMAHTVAKNGSKRLCSVSNRKRRKLIADRSYLRKGFRQMTKAFFDEIHFRMDINSSFGARSQFYVK